MFLQYRTYAETILEEAINETDTITRLFAPDVMPDTPFLLFLAAGTSLSDLQTAERVLCYQRDGDDFHVARDWDNMRPASGVEATITGNAGDTSFTLPYLDFSYIRIGNSPFLYRYLDSGTIEPPLQEDYVDAPVRLVGEHWPLDRRAAWPAGTLALLLLGDVNIEELQDANREYELPAHLEATTLTLLSHLKVGASALEENGVIKYENDDFWGFKDGAWVSLSQQGGGGGGWDPPEGEVGDIVYYDTPTTLVPTSRIKVLDRIHLDSKFSVNDTDLQYGYLSLTETALISGNVQGEGVFIGNYGQGYEGTLTVEGEIQVGEILHAGINTLHVAQVTHISSNQYDIILNAPLTNAISNGDDYITANNLRRELTIAGSNVLLAGDQIDITGYASVDIYSSHISLNDKLEINGDIEAKVPLKIEDYSHHISRADYPADPSNGMIIFHTNDGLMGYSAGAWHPVLVEDIDNPFPVPADQYATVAYDPVNGWQPTSELLLDPDGAKFSHAVVIGEKKPDAPLQAGMIEYVNNDIQGIVRQGEAFVRVSLTNLIPGQRLPEPEDGLIPYASGGLWVGDANFTFAGGLLRSHLLQLGSQTGMAGTIRYNTSSMQWHDGSIWREFAGGGASVADPTIAGSMLVSNGTEWVEAPNLIFEDNEIQADSARLRGLRVINLSDEITASITAAGAINASSLTVGGVQISSLGITGVSNMQVMDMIVSNVLTVKKLNLEEMPEEWSFDRLNLGAYSFLTVDGDLHFTHNDTLQVKYTPAGVIFKAPVTMDDLNIDGEVKFNYAIAIGDEKEPGLQDIPGMIRYNGDFQGHLGDGRWVSFTLSLSDGHRGLPGNGDAPFGSGLVWNGSQWFRSPMRIGDDGAIFIGSTDTAQPGVIRWTGANFQGCVDYGSWVNLTGSTGGASLPEGLVENSTLRWNGTDWIENPQLRSDAILTTMPLIRIEPYENFYDVGAVRETALAGEDTIQIKDFSTVPYGTIKFANHDTLYTVIYATSEEMLIEEQGVPGGGLTTNVSAGTLIHIQGVLPRPEAEGGQVRFNQNDYEGFVEGIGWVSFTGNLSYLPTREGDPKLRNGHGLYFDGSIWRAYHDIYFLPDAIKVERDLEVFGDINTFGMGRFDGVKVSATALQEPGMIRFKNNRYEGCTIEGTWTYLSSPIYDEDATNGQTLIYSDGWWYNTGLLTVNEATITAAVPHIHFDAWDLYSHEYVGEDDVQPALSFSVGDRFDIIEMRGLGNEQILGREVLVRARTRMLSLIVGHPEEDYDPLAMVDIADGLRVGTDLWVGATLNALGHTTLGSGEVTGNFEVKDTLTIKNDLYVTDGSIYTFRLTAQDSGFFGTTVRVGFKAGPADVGAIRYSTPGNVARGDWEGWDGEQWVSFTAGFHGQAIWGDPDLGDIVAFDGERWRPSMAMNVVDNEVRLGRTYLHFDSTPATEEDEGRIRFTGTHVEACIGEVWVPLNGDPADLPDGSTEGQILHWMNGSWTHTERLLVANGKTRLNNVLELAPYDEIISPAQPAPGQIRYNQNDYEAFIANIGWISLTGHVPFQKPWEHTHRFLWSDGSNWVASPLLEYLGNTLALHAGLSVLGDLAVEGPATIKDRITVTDGGILLGNEVDPAPYTLYRDPQNRLIYDGKTFMVGESNVDDSIPRGAVYYENQQFRNAAKVRMMTRSVA